ncbi:MAG: hypothetical protein HS113_07805 [Verrucomicrobiales bacterium]|nr:hypothetical protein [Verrucomicrobiales bacterium]
MPTSLSRFVTLLVAAPVIHAAALVDPGFETYAVEPGTFVRPASGPWSFDNDAAVVKPFAPPTSTGSFNTWSAALSPWEGEQYASTYAGGDRLQQTVTFDAPGVFELSVYAAAPAGTLTLPGIATVTLGDGEFRFTIDGFYLILVRFQVETNNPRPSRKAAHPIGCRSQGTQLASRSAPPPVPSVQDQI